MGNLVSIWLATSVWKDTGIRRGFRPNNRTISPTDTTIAGNRTLFCGRFNNLARFWSGLGNSTERHDPPRWKRADDRKRRIPFPDTSSSDQRHRGGIVLRHWKCIQRDLDLLVTGLHSLGRFRPSIPDSSGTCKAGFRHQSIPENQTGRNTGTAVQSVLYVGEYVLKMKARHVLKPALWLCALVALCFVAHAEVIDRIVAVVDGHIITLSDLRREREIRGELGDRAIDDNHILAGQLIENYLIEMQIADYPNIDVTDAEVDADLAQLRARGITASDTLRDAVRRRIRIQKFFDMKFRQLIRPTDEEILKYYDEVFVPEAQKRGLQSVPPLTNSEMATAIRENVIQERLDHEVTLWIEAIRRRSNVEIFD